MSQETAQLQDGDSQSWEFRVSQIADISVRSSVQPYDIDVESKRPGEPDSAYSRVTQFDTFYQGVLTVTSTGLKELTLPTQGVIRVTVSNNSGEVQTPVVSVTPSDPQELFYEDGRAMVDAQEALVEQLDVSELAAALDAAGYDITGIGNAEAESVSTTNASIAEGGKLSNGSDTDNAITFKSFNLPAGQTTEFFPEVNTSSRYGIFIVRFVADSAIIHLRGGAGNVSIIADPNSKFSNSQGTPDSINIFYDGSTYQIENTESTDREMKVERIQ